MTHLISADPLGVSTLPAVSLERLVAEAALMTRVDRKYLLPVNDVAAVIGGLGLGVQVLEIDGSRTFDYDSVYFDTDDHLAYRLTAQRRRHRFKLRTRSYLSTGASFLEVKTKDGRGSTVKERIPYDPEHRMHLTSDGVAFAAEVLHLHGHPADLVDTLQPRLVSRYRRTTLLLADGSRATVDTHLRWCDITAGHGASQVGEAHPGTARQREEHSAEVALTGQAIVESKARGRASALDRALWRAGHRPSGISKFGTGTAALHPELPRNTWARTLNTRFPAVDNGTTEYDSTPENDSTAQIRETKEARS